MASIGRLFEYKPQNELISLGYRGEAEGTESRVGDGDTERSGGRDTNLATLVLQYTKQELASYTKSRIAGISKASVPWMKQCSAILWDVIKGTISKQRCDALRQHIATRYNDAYAPRKVLNFATAFLKYLAKMHFDTRYKAFELFLELPKGLKVRKHVTSRIVTEEDVRNVLSAFERAYQRDEIDRAHYLHYRAIVLFSAFTGQRSQATIARLRVGQFMAAIASKKPVIEI